MPSAILKVLLPINTEPLLTVKVLSSPLEDVKVTLSAPVPAA